jgi:hypothetical protein
MNGGEKKQTDYKVIRLERKMKSSDVECPAFQTFDI